MNRDSGSGTGTGAGGRRPSIGSSAARHRRPLFEGPRAAATTSAVVLGRAAVSLAASAGRALPQHARASATAAPKLEVAFTPIRSVARVAVPLAHSSAPFKDLIGY